MRLKGRDVQLAGVATHYVDSDKVCAFECLVKWNLCTLVVRLVT